MLKYVFLDRDGVLIKDYGYVHSISKTKWLKGSINAIKFLNKKEILTIIITISLVLLEEFLELRNLKIFIKI